MYAGKGKCLESQNDKSFKGKSKIITGIHWIDAGKEGITMGTLVLSYGELKILQQAIYYYIVVKVYL